MGRSSKWPPTPPRAPRPRSVIVNKENFPSPTPNRLGVFLGGGGQSQPGGGVGARRATPPQVRTPPTPKSGLSRLQLSTGQGGAPPPLGGLGKGTGEGRVMWPVRTGLWTPLSWGEGARGGRGTHIRGEGRHPHLISFLGSQIHPRTPITPKIPPAPQNLLQNPLRTPISPPGPSWDPQNP